MCSWNDDTQVCSHNDIGTFNVLYVVATLALSFFINVPIRLLVDFIIETNILAPTKVEADSDDDDKIRKQSVVPLALRRMSKKFKCSFW
jgi:hypothetical protein